MLVDRDYNQEVDLLSVKESNHFDSVLNGLFKTQPGRMFDSEPLPS